MAAEAEAEAAAEAVPGPATSGGSCPSSAAIMRSWPLMSATCSANT